MKNNLTIEVCMTEYCVDKSEKPFFWRILQYKKDDPISHTLDGGFSDSPNEAWEAAYEAFNKLKEKRTS